MRDFRKCVETRLDDRIKATMPQFARRHYNDIPPVVSYVCEASHSLFFHIVPNIDLGRRAFSVEISTTTTDRSPIRSRLGTPGTIADDGDLRFAISHLWSQNAEDWVVAVEEADFFWTTGVRFRPSEIENWIAAHSETYPREISQLQRLTWPLVDDLVEKIQEYAIPYFMRIAAERGIEWRISMRAPKLLE